MAYAVFSTGTSPALDGVHDLALDIEGREIRQQVVKRARDVGDGFRIDHPFEVLQVGIEVADDVQTEGQRRCQHRARKRRKEQRNRHDDGELQKDHRDRFQQRRIDSGASQCGRNHAPSIHATAPSTA